MISQSMLPVVTEDNNYLGWVTLDSPTTFVGNETTKSVASKTLPIQRFTYKRVHDQVTVDFMGIYVSLASVRAGNWNTFPNFSEMGANVAYKPWQMTGSHVYSPQHGGGLNLNVLQTFLNNPSF